MAFPNHYIHRRVAEEAAKACDVCYKTSSSVLITPDNKDFFYVCALHLKDRYFCTPKVDEDAVKARRERELAEEKERVVKEYEERKRKKEEEKKKKEEKEDKKDKKEEDKKDEKEEDKKHADQKVKDDCEKPEEEPRVFELKSAFYQQRLQRKRHAETAKRDRERVSQPGYFPSVPSEAPKR